MAAVKDGTPKHYNSSTRRSDMTNRVLLALACVLLVVRLPSLVQPMGADRACMRTWANAFDPEICRIATRGIRSRRRSMWPTRAMRAIVPRDAAVPAADLLAAAVIAVMLWRLGGALAGGSVGPWAAVVFLLLSNPAFARLGGVSVRAQCETFIAVAVTAAFLCLARARTAPNSDQPVCRRRRALRPGVHVQIQRGRVCRAPALFALLLWKRLTPAIVASH